MQVKIFESTDMASGLKLVKETLGPDALILSTRTLRNGKLGILGRPTLEITAAIDSPLPVPKQGYQPPEPALNQTRQKPFSQWADDTVQPKVQLGQAITFDSRFRVQQEPGEIRPLPPGKRDHIETPALASAASGQVNEAEPRLRPSPLLPPQPTPVSSRETHPEMHNELDELKMMVKKLGQEMSRLGAAGNDRQQEMPAEPTPACTLQDQSLNCQEENAGRLLSMLMDQGLSESTAKEISAQIQDNLPPEEAWDNTPQQNKLLRATIREILHVAPPFLPETNGQRRIALVGPTGVGKTTTLAKIAAHYLTHFSNAIALITIDTYRIAAVEQLKVYGAIMNLPVEVVITPEQLEQALSVHRDKELILIDTAGRSPRDSLCIEELAAFLRPDLAIDKHLVLSATTRRSELLEAIRRFGRLGIDNTIITKTDECSTLGVMLDIQMHDRDNPIPFSWITNGQRVPEDLLPAGKELMAELIMTPFTGNNP